MAGKHRAERQKSEFVQQLLEIRSGFFNTVRAVGFALGSGASFAYSAGIGAGRRARTNLRAAEVVYQHFVGRVVQLTILAYSPEKPATEFGIV